MIHIFLVLLELEILSINNFSKHCKIQMQLILRMTHICVGVQMLECEHRFLPYGLCEYRTFSHFVLKFFFTHF